MYGSAGFQTTQLHRLPEKLDNLSTAAPIFLCQMTTFPSSLPLMTKLSLAPPKEARMTHWSVMWPRNFCTVALVNKSISWASLSPLLTSSCRESWLMARDIGCAPKSSSYSNALVIPLYTYMFVKLSAATSHRPSGEPAMACTRCFLSHWASSSPSLLNVQMLRLLSRVPRTKDLLSLDQMQLLTGSSNLFSFLIN